MSSQTQSLFKKREALSEDYIPEQLIHRYSQLDQISSLIEPIFIKKPAKAMIIHGSSGSGKTVTCKSLLREIVRRDEKVRTAYVNCSIAYTQFDVLKEVGRQLGMTFLNNVTSNELRFRIEKCSERYSCVVILDEADFLSEKRTLYWLARCQLSLILVFNKLNAFYRLDDRIKSRIGPWEEIHFPPYSFKELNDLVSMRTDLVLLPNKISKEQIQKISVCAAGNGHLAISSIRIAVDRAENEGSSQIEDSHVTFAVIRSIRSLFVRRVEQLNDDQRKLLKIIKRNGKITASNLHKQYQESIKTPVCERTVRNYLQKLEKYGFIRMSGHCRWRVYLRN